MKSLLHLSLAFTGLALLSSCETTYNDDETRRHNHGNTTTTTTKETTRRGPTVNAPISTTVETQTTRVY
jgi:hypothetical protein